MHHRWLIACSALLLAACSTSPSLPNGHAIGEPMRVQETHRFAKLDATPTEFYHKTVLAEATVRAVCQNKGCWMQVEDDGRTAMVRWETGCGGKYAFPKDAVGKRVLIQGSFYPKTISAEDAKHIEEEAKGSVAVAREGYEFNASAVLIMSE